MNKRFRIFQASKRAYCRQAPSQEGHREEVDEDMPDNTRQHLSEGVSDKIPYPKTRYQKKKFRLYKTKYIPVRKRESLQEAPA